LFLTIKALLFGVRDFVSISQQVEKIITDPLLHKGYAVVRVQLSGDKRRTLQIMIEKVDGQTITVDDCATASYRSLFSWIRSAFSKNR
jgi:ribosome maturation factor RimP